MFAINTQFLSVNHAYKTIIIMDFISNLISKCKIKSKYIFGSLNFVSLANEGDIGDIGQLHTANNWSHANICDRTTSKQSILRPCFIYKFSFA